MVATYTSDSAPNRTATGQWNWMVQPKDCLLITKISSSESKNPRIDSRDVRQQTQQPGLEQNDSPDLARRRAPRKRKQSEFAAAIDHQSQQRAAHAHHGYEYGDGFERIGDGKGAVEDAHRFFAQGAIQK